MSDMLPQYVRATRVTRKRPSPIFGKTYYSYDIRFQGGRIQEDVNLDHMVQGARYPADYHTVKNGAQAMAGDGVPGAWVDYPYGRPVSE